MNKYFDFFLPIIAILMGWVLNEFSGILKTKKDDKKTLNQTVLVLLEIKNFIKATLSNMQRAAQYASCINADTSSMEERRKRNTELTILNLEELESNLQYVKNEIAKYDPLLSNKVTGMASIKMINNLRLKEISEVPELYIDLLLLHESILSLVYDDVSELIVKLSKKVSILYYLKNKNELIHKDDLIEKSILDYFDKDTIAKYLEYKKKDTSMTADEWFEGNLRKFSGN